jgi:hypothetical protein
MRETLLPTVYAVVFIGLAVFNTWSGYSPTASVAFCAAAALCSLSHYHP